MNFRLPLKKNLLETRKYETHHTSVIDTHRTRKTNKKSLIFNIQKMLDRYIPHIIFITHLMIRTFLWL